MRSHGKHLPVWARGRGMQLAMDRLAAGCLGPQGSAAACSALRGPPAGPLRSARGSAHSPPGSAPWPCALPTTRLRIVRDLEALGEQCVRVRQVEAEEGPQVLRHLRARRESQGRAGGCLRSYARGSMALRPWGHCITCTAESRRGRQAHHGRQRVLRPRRAGSDDPSLERRLTLGNMAPRSPSGAEHALRARPPKSEGRTRCWMAPASAMSPAGRAHACQCACAASEQGRHAWLAMRGTSLGGHHGSGTAGWEPATGRTLQVKVAARPCKRPGVMSPTHPRRWRGPRNRRRRRRPWARGARPTRR